MCLFCTSHRVTESRGYRDSTKSGCVNVLLAASLKMWFLYKRGRTHPRIWLVFGVKSVLCCEVGVYNRAGVGFVQVVNHCVII